MKPFRIAIVTLLAMSLASCGWLSNPYYEDGYGVVYGRLVADGKPLEGTLVFVMDDDLITITTEPDGKFELQPVPAGRNRALVAVWGSSLGLQTPFDLAADGKLDKGDMELEPLSLLQGEVSLPDPQLAEVRVKQTPFVARPDRSGKFSLMLPRGTWDLEVTALGYLPEAIDDVIVDSGDTLVLSGSVQPDVDENYVCTDPVPIVEHFYQGGRGTVDVLFIVDNSGSMVGEQRALGNSFSQFTDWLKAGYMDYRIAVVSTGMESAGCPPCDPPDIPGSCINETGENGRFQDRICRNTGTVDDPVYDCQPDQSCRVVDETNLVCFYDHDADEGIVFVGVDGCGYERGLAAMRRALQVDLLNTYNSGFLRDGARLAVIVVSDEEDCGEVGDVTENIDSARGNICFFAANGAGPENETFHPDDPDEKTYELTPVDEYAQFLQELKTVPGQVTFSAIVGLEDPEFPENTRIRYFWNQDVPEPRWDIENACEVLEPDCTGLYCFAKPGTRYVELAQTMGGAVETICQKDFSEPMERVVSSSTGFRRTFRLSKRPLSHVLVYVDGVQSDEHGQYYSEKQAFVFYDDSIPEPYSLIEFRYHADCP